MVADLALFNQITKHHGETNQSSLDSDVEQDDFL